MALDKDALRAALVVAFTQNLPDITDEQQEAIDAVAVSFSDAIDDYVRGGVIAAGVPVLVNLGTGIGATTADAQLE